MRRRCLRRDMRTRQTNSTRTALGVVIAGLLLLAPNPPVARASGGTASALASGPSWSPITKGLPRGSVTSVEVGRTSSGTTVYAGAETGLFTSSDGGRHWTHVAPIATDIFGPPAEARVVPATEFAVDGSTAYLASPFIGTFRSGDEGATWVPTNPGSLGPISVPFSLAVETDTSGQTAYAAVWYKGGQFFQDLYRTTDGGASWQALPGAPGGALVVDRYESRTTVYEASFSAGPGFTGGVFASDDGGVSWTPVGTDWPTLEGDPVVAVDHGPAGVTVYAAARTLGGNDEVLRSTDGGPWEEADSGLTGHVETLAVDRFSTGVTLYAGTDAGAFRSFDEGASWAPVDRGLAGASVHSIAVDRRGSKATVYAGTDRGLFTTRNDGKRWKRSPLLIARVNALAVDRGPSSATLYASSGVLFRSTTGGARWRATRVPTVRDFAVDRTASGSNVYAVGDQVFRSANNGRDWTEFPGPGPLGAVTVDRGSGSSVTLYAGASSGVGSTGIFRSIDEGATWDGIGPEDGTLTGGFAAVAVDRAASGSTIYAGASPTFSYEAHDGVYRSVDGGDTWTAGSGITDTNVNALVVDRAASGLTLYAGTERAGVFRSVDGGATWVPAGGGLSPAPIRALVMDQTPAGSTLYAGTYGDGVFESSDGGATWTPVNAGLADHFIDALAVDSSPSGPTIYAGTYMGVFALRG